jgi:hypothetical protein
LIITLEGHFAAFVVDPNPVGLFQDLNLRVADLREMANLIASKFSPFLHE